MKKKVISLMMVCMLAVGLATGCGSKDAAQTSNTVSDQEAADKVAELIDAIYVQERTDKTDEQCAAAKKAWDALTDAQKELVSGEIH